MTGPGRAGGGKGRAHPVWAEKQDTGKKTEKH